MNVLPLIVCLCILNAALATWNALGEGRERGILREASSGEAATSTDGLGVAVPPEPTFERVEMNICNECAARDNEITRQRKEAARWKSRAAMYEKQAARRKGLLREALAWIENSQESAPSLCGDIRKALGLTPNVGGKGGGQA